MAHEINNPVAIMIKEAGWVMDLMSDEKDCLAASPNRQEYERAMHQIDTQGRRCKEITHKLLGFARRTDAPAQLTQLNDLVGEVVDLIARPASYANIRIVQDLAPDPPRVNASPSELQQVLINLIKNSSDALAASGGEITVTTRPEGTMGVLLTVSDNGPGIPEAVLPRIFDPFFTTKPVGQGHGLGVEHLLRHRQQAGGQDRGEEQQRGGRYLPGAPAGHAPGMT